MAIVDLCLAGGIDGAERRQRHGELLARRVGRAMSVSLRNGSCVPVATLSNCPILRKS